jgi:hypothetical protein
MNRFPFTHLIVIATACLACIAAAATKPNIVLFVTDDQSPIAGCYGSPVMQTPALDALAKEGTRFTAASDIKGTVTNLPVPDMPGRWKYESDHAVSAGSPLNIAGAGLEEYHFITSTQSKRVIVSAPGTDVPTLRYKTFFYNACSTGPHFIEKFDHGEFIYTNRLCAVFRATELFVKGLIEEKTTAEILGILEAADAAGEENQNVITYEVKNP